MNEDDFWQSRTETLLGSEALHRLHEARVMLFGCGGVGGWAAEALIRTGVGHLSLVDKDIVEASNLNRQLAATIGSVGSPKVDALKARLLCINPQADIDVFHAPFTADTAADFPIADSLIVLDAIDSVPDKATLIRLSCQIPDITLFSAMGAARRTDPLQVRVSDFAKVQGCPLARALRTRFKKDGNWPAHKFQCVWSMEQPSPNVGKGSLTPVVGTFGMVLASLAIKEIIKKT